MAYNRVPSNADVELLEEDPVVEEKSVVEEKPVVEENDDDYYFNEELKMVVWKGEKEEAESFLTLAQNKLYGKSDKYTRKTNYLFCKINDTHKGNDYEDYKEMFTTLQCSSTLSGVFGMMNFNDDSEQKSKKKFKERFQTLCNKITTESDTEKYQDFWNKMLGSMDMRVHHIKDQEDMLKYDKILEHELYFQVNAAHDNGKELVEVILVHCDKEPWGDDDEEEWVKVEANDKQHYLHNLDLLFNAMNVANFHK